MKIIGLDPGNETSALVVWDGEAISWKMHEDNDSVLQWLESVAWAAKQSRDKPPMLVIEMIGHYGTGMPAGKSVFDTCVFIGMAKYAYGRKFCEIMLRPTVKAHICGSARAKDGNVIAALKDRFGEKGTKANPGVAFGMKADLWQAWALAVCWWDQNVGPMPHRELARATGVTFEELGR